MKKKRQRIWAALLVMVLCLSLFPKSAFAEEVQTGFGVTIGEGAETFYTSFADAWNAACGKETSAVLTMYEDCTEITKYVVPQGKTVTLDLNGRAVENASNTQSGGFEVLGEFTLQDSASGGMIMGSGITVGNDEVSGTFTMKSGTIKGTMKEELNGRKTTGVWVFNGTFNMTGGTITEHRAGGVDVNMNTTFNMEGGEITNNTTGVTVSGAFNMKGGTISRNTSTEGGDSVHVYSPGKMTVKGSHTLDGSLVITSGAAMTIASDANLTLTGGAGLNNSGMLTVKNRGKLKVDGENISRIPIINEKNATIQVNDWATLEVVNTPEKYEPISNNGKIENGSDAKIEVDGTLDGVGSMSSKFEPKKTDFTYKPPTNLVCNGKGKSAAVTSKYYGANITITYKKGTAAATEQAPTEVGTYQVLLSVAETGMYHACNNLQVGEFTIQECTWNEPVYEWSTDGKKCTASRTSVEDAAYKQTADADVTSSVTKAPTCTERGETTCTAEFSVDWAKRQTKTVPDIPADEHTWSTTYAKENADADKHYHICATCGAKDNGEAHTWNVEKATEDTDKFCTVCGCVAETKLQHKHSNGTLVKGTTASCTTPGIKDYYECNCGKFFEDADCTKEITNLDTWKVIPAQGHQPEADDGDCTTPVKCSVCGEITTAGADSHIGGTATCVEKAHCERCGMAYGTLMPHDFTGNDYGHHKAGHWRICNREGCEATDILEAHIWNVEKATEDTDKHCTVCGYVAETKLENAQDNQGNQEDQNNQDNQGDQEDQDNQGGGTLAGGTPAGETPAGETKPNDKFSPEITYGQNSIYKSGSGEGMTFRSNASLTDFISVLVDGKVIAATNYTVKEGSTIVTLKAGYLATLSVGKHTLGINSATGIAETTFAIEAKSKSVEPSKTDSVQTGDINNMGLWITLLAVSCGGVVTAAVYGKKKRKN